MALQPKILRLILVAGLAVLCDQVTKILILNGLPYGASIPVIPGWFDIVHVYNPGGAFGFLARQGDLVRKLMFVGISGVASLLILWFYHSTPNRYRWLQTGLALIFGGAIGNLVDRVRFGYVVDFLDVHWQDLHWPAFNIADSAICIGMAIFIYHVIFKKMPESF